MIRRQYMGGMRRLMMKHARSFRVALFGIVVLATVVLFKQAFSLATAPGFGELAVASPPPSIIDQPIDTVRAEAQFSDSIALLDDRSGPRQQSSEAVLALSKMIKDFPALPEPYNNLAVIYAEQGDYGKAQSALRAALSTHPSYAVVHDNLNTLYSSMAEEAYRRAFGSAPGGERPRLTLVREFFSFRGGALTSRKVAPLPGLRSATDQVASRDGPGEGGAGSNGAGANRASANRVVRVAVSPLAVQGAN